jgi:hypothetical protein
MDTIQINGNTYEISGYAEDGLPIIQANATTVQDGFDESGNPKVSTIINVPPIKMGIAPGGIE